MNETLDTQTTETTDTTIDTTDTAQMPQLPPTPPQFDPSQMPTLDPSQMPTLDPSQMPTLDPSQMPTLDATQMPTLDGSQMLTLDGSQMPQMPPPPPMLGQGFMAPPPDMSAWGNGEFTGEQLLNGENLTAPDDLGSITDASTDISVNLGEQNGFGFPPAGMMMPFATDGGQLTEQSTTTDTQAE